MADLAEETPIKNTSSLPRSARRCRIPKLSRSSSVRLRADDHEGPRACDTRPKSMTISNPRDYPWPMESRYGDLGSVTSMPFSIDDDHSSVRSFGSFVSYNSYASQSQRTETSMSRPLSSRTHCKKYVLHCDRHLAKQEEYLTPTQRKDKEIRHLKSALMKQTKLCEEKQVEIERLKTEVERIQEALSGLRMGKENLMNSSQESDQLDSLNAKNSTSEISFESQVTDKSDMQALATLNNDDSGISNTTAGSPRDSAELEDIDIQPCKVETAEKSVCTDLSFFDCPPPVNENEPVFQTSECAQQNLSDTSAIECCNENSSNSESKEIFAITASPRLSQEFERFLGTYQKELDQLKAQHREHYYDLKDRFNERVDDLLLKLTEANSRYLELRPLFDRAQDKILSIEGQLGDVQKDLESQEDYHKQMYFKMYRWKKTFKACLCISVVGLAMHHIQPFINIPDFSTFKYYFSPSVAYENLCSLTNWVELKLQ